MASTQINSHKEAQKTLHPLISRCVHCGFCNATCPSYQVLGNELDGPRGRIYQIANMINQESDDKSIREHLDTCLFCRNCETTCPSGVEYGAIFDLGKKIAVEKYPYTIAHRCKQHLLVAFLTNRLLTRLFFSLASLLRFFLPAKIRALTPKREAQLPLLTIRAPTKRVLLLQGCLQQSALPNVDRALHNLCARVGIQLDVLKSTCCAALPHHNNQRAKAKEVAKANIDAAMRHIESGISAITMTASACTLQLKEYVQLLQDDPIYKEKSRIFSDLVCDPSALFDDKQLPFSVHQKTLAFHPPCTLQHGLGEHKQVQTILQKAGFSLLPVTDSHLCCGSAGSYSLFHPHIAGKMGDKKVQSLLETQADYIATANIGCQLFLQRRIHKKVWHWVELLEDAARNCTSTPGTGTQ